MLEELLGAQLLEIDQANDKFTVKLSNGEIRNYEIIEDEGDCCGFNEFNILVIDKEELDRNPIITNITTEKDDDRDSDVLKLTFFGENKAIAEVNSLSSSGSGWCYGACVTLRCCETNEEYGLTSY
jgi:hypothetical protein